MMARSVAPYLVLTAMVSGCHIFDLDSCLYELRSVEVAGQLNEGGAELLFASVNVGEQRDYQPDKNMLWLIRSAPLLGHVTSATLKDEADESKILYNFPISTTSQTDRISSGYVAQVSGANLNGFFEVLSGDRAIIEVKTDVPGKGTLRILPEKVFDQDWTRPKCG
jgi:hypothetical protein